MSCPLLNWPSSNPPDRTKSVLSFVGIDVGKLIEALDYSALTRLRLPDTLEHRSDRFRILPKAKPLPWAP